jgi:hypothetical protein
MKIKISLILIQLIISLSSSGFCAPVLETPGPVVDLGYISPGAVVMENIIILNNGDIPLIINPAGFSPDLFPEFTQVIIEPGQKQPLPVKISIEGYTDTYLRIESNDPENLEMVVYFSYILSERVFLHPRDFININQYPGSPSVYTVYAYSTEENLEVGTISASSEYIHVKAEKTEAEPVKGIRSAWRLMIAYSDRVQPGSYDDFLDIPTNHGDIRLRINSMIKPLVNILPLGAHFRTHTPEQEPFFIHLINTQKKPFNVVEAVFDKSSFDIKISSADDIFVKKMEISLKKPVSEPAVKRIELKIDLDLHPCIYIPVYID